MISFRKSYRTTDEIMTVANNVAESLNLETSELSIRYGENVTFNHVEKENLPAYIKNKIIEYKEKNYKTIAVIRKYPVQSSYITDDLSFEGLVVLNIDKKTDVTTNGNGISTITNYLAKGLEYEVVILNDVSEEIYNSDRRSDVKMLYAVLMRALHEMDIVYSNL